MTQAPAVAALAQVGQRLQAQGATWTGRAPISATYSWLRCDTEALWVCRFIDAADGPSYLVTAADLGKRLRAVVVVSNPDGRDYGWSAPTAAVAAAPPPPPPVGEPPPSPVPAPLASPAPPSVSQTPSSTPRGEARVRMMRPAPRVRIRGWLTGRGAMITRLTVRAPRGAKIAVRCSGPSCPRKSLARTARLTRLAAFERRLRAGTRLVIRVTRPGFVSRHTVIRIRRGKAPARRDLCLLPGAKGPATCPAG